MYNNISINLWIKMMILIDMVMKIKLEITIIMILQLYVAEDDKQNWIIGCIVHSSVILILSCPSVCCHEIGAAMAFVCICGMGDK